MQSDAQSAMSAGLDSVWIHSSNAGEVLSAVPPQSFNPTAMSRLEGRPVVRFPEQLRLHRSLEDLSWTGVIDEFNDAARLKDQPVPVPILVTTTGRFWLALAVGAFRRSARDQLHRVSPQ